MHHPAVTVSVAGGYELDRAGLEVLISSLPGLRVVPMDHEPQVLVYLQGAGTSNLLSRAPGPAVVMLVEEADLDSLPEAVLGLVSRDESLTILAMAIRQVARGEQYLSPSLAARILKNRQLTAQVTESQKSALGALSDREREILDLLADGLSNKMIAARLYLSVRTVEGHLANIYAGLHVHSRTEAMLIALKLLKRAEKSSGSFTQFP